MSARLAVLLAAMAGACVCGCATSAEAQRGDAATGRGWIVSDDAAAAAVLRTCSRPSPDREATLARWTPTKADIAVLERALPSLAAGSDPARYHRQYVGIVRDGRRLIYLNAWPAHLPAVDDPTREAVRACDGGAQFWGAVWDPQSGAFSEREANGGY